MVKATKIKSQVLILMGLLARQEKWDVS